VKAVILQGKIREDADPDEQDVLVQVRAVSQALAELGYEPVTLALSLNMAETIDRLLQEKPGFVFNLVEAVEGKGALICVAPLLLESLGLPYTGAQAEAMFLTSAKLTAKKLLRAQGIATPDFIPDDGSWPDGVTEASYIVKSAWEHASLGLDEDSILHTADVALLRARILSLQTSLGGGCFAERFIEGREINISLLADQAAVEELPPAEILFSEYPPEKIRMLGYRAKWAEHSFEYQHTVRTFAFAPEDAPLLERLRAISLACWQLFNLRGYARVDFRVDSAGKPWVLEVNANPCLSPDSGFVAAAQQRGLAYPQVIERIVRDIPARVAG